MYIYLDSNEIYVLKSIFNKFFYENGLTNDTITFSNIINKIIVKEQGKIFKSWYDI